MPLMRRSASGALIPFKDRPTLLISLRPALIWLRAFDTTWPATAGPRSAGHEVGMNDATTPAASTIAPDALRHSLSAVDTTELIAVRPTLLVSLEASAKPPVIAPPTSLKPPSTAPLALLKPLLKDLPMLRFRMRMAVSVSFSTVVGGAASSPVEQLTANMAATATRARSLRRCGNRGG